MIQCFFRVQLLKAWIIHAKGNSFCKNERKIVFFVFIRSGTSQLPVLQHGEKSLCLYFKVQRASEKFYQMLLYCNTLLF